MEDLINILKAQAASIAADVAVINENNAAMNVMADDIVDAVERRDRGHVEFSMFAPDGRA